MPKHQKHLICSKAFLYKTWTAFFHRLSYTLPKCVTTYKYMNNLNLLTILIALKDGVCNLCTTRLLYDYGTISQKWHASSLTSHVCLLVAVFNTTEMEGNLLLSAAFFHLSHLEGENVSNSDLSVPAPPTGQSDSGSASSLIAIVISPASPVSKPPRNQTSQGGLYSLPAHGVTWHELPTPPLHS